jgi:hypothetical protein
MAKKPMNDVKLKNHIISLRLDEEQVLYLKAANALLDEHRPAGCAKISKTDTIKTLMLYGMEVFNQRFGNPLAENKKASDE